MLYFIDIYIKIIQEKIGLVRNIKVNSLIENWKKRVFGFTYIREITLNVKNLIFLPYQVESNLIERVR